MTESADLMFSVASSDLEALEAQVLVLGAYSTEQGPQLAEHSLDSKTAEGLQAILKDMGVTGSADQLTRLPGFEGTATDVVAIIGLGAPTENPQDQLCLLYTSPSPRD